jgi:hypothetical protein
MFNIKTISTLTLTILVGIGGSKALALPGQSTEQVITWVNAHPTLKPSTDDGLTVKKSNSPTQRFTFEASVLPPGRLTLVKDRGKIKSERFTFFDMINGVTSERLQESIRIIYGLDIYQDFQQAKVVYAYPSLATIDLAKRQNRPLLAARQGELRLGDRYAYLIEVTNTDKGKAYHGEVTVFLKDYLQKLEVELSDR